MKTIHKTFILLLIVVMVMFSFVGCSSSPKPEKDNSEKVAADQGKEAEETKVETNEDQDREEISGGVNLPEGYPIDLVPIMDDASSGSGMETGGVFNITYSTPSTLEQVMEFYGQHFQQYGDAVIIADSNREINLTAEGRDIQILVDSSGQATSLRIFVGGISEQSANLNEDSNSESDNEAQDDSGQFPTDLVPIMDGGEVYDMSSQSVNFTTKKSFKDVAGFYKDIVNAMENANISDGDYEFFATASKGDNSVEIQIMDTGDNQIVVLINIYPE